MALFLRLSAPLHGQEENLGPLDESLAERVANKSLCGFEGTPLRVVEKMLELAQVRPNEQVYDLGSGDGRIVIMAAQKFGARGIGIELDPRRCRQSLEKIEELGLSHQVQIIEGDFLEQDLSHADVVTLFLTSSALQTLKPHMERFLHHGMRVVTCEEQMPGWEPVTTITTPGDNKRSYKLTLYVVSRPSDWVSFSKFGRTP